MNTNTVQDDTAGSIEMHCNPAIITYKNTNIHKYKKYRQKKLNPEVYHTMKIQ